MSNTQSTDKTFSGSVRRGSQRTSAARGVGVGEETAKVIVVGSMSADVTAFSESRPAPGETLIGTDVTMVLGGKGANQAVAARRSGAEAIMVGCVGTDSFHSLVLGSLDAENVDTSSIQAVDGPTGIAHIRVVASGENDIVVVPLANAQLTPERVEAVLRDRGRAGDSLLIQLEIPVETALRAAEVGREIGMTVILDPAPAAAIAGRDDFWANVSAVTPNETEAQLLTGIEVTDVDSAVRAGRWFNDAGVPRAIITMASHGLVVVTADGHTFYPPFSVKAVDTTAAGDAFAGALAARLVHSGEEAWDEAVRFASAAGALAVTVRGASPSIHTLEEIEALIASS